MSITDDNSNVEVIIDAFSSFFENSVAKYSKKDFLLSQLTDFKSALFTDLNTFEVVEKFLNDLKERGIIFIININSLY